MRVSVKLSRLADQIIVAPGWHGLRTQSQKGFLNAHVIFLHTCSYKGYFKSYEDAADIELDMMNLLS